MSIKAALILEWIITQNGLKLLLPHLELFTKNLHKLNVNGPLRACAKICEHIAIAYTSKKTHDIQHILTDQQKDKIVAVGFDWLITPQKIAVKAYTMTILYLFGLEKDWVHPELKHLITTDIIYQSKGCAARGKKILKLIYKNS